VTLLYVSYIWLLVHFIISLVRTVHLYVDRQHDCSVLFTVLIMKQHCVIQY